MTDLVLYDNGSSLTQQEEELLFERTASHYLRLQDERNGKKVKVSEAVDAVLAAHVGEYSEVAAHAAVKCAEFDDYLATRRKDHLLTRLVPSLYAAEMGMRIGTKAADELMKRLNNENAVTLMSDKDLLSLVKTGFEFAQKIDKSIEEVSDTTNIKVNVDLKGLLLGLPPEMAADYMAEIGRRMIAGDK